MRRQIAITAFALALALPLWAQHGGGHAGGAHGGGFSGHAGFGGGHGGGFSGGHVGGGHFSGGHFSGGMRSSPRVSRGFSRSPSFSRPSARRGFSNSHFRQNRFRGPRIRTFGFRNNCFGFGCRGFGYPWAYGAYYDPWWWWDSGSSYDDDYERDRSIANDMNEQSLEQQRMLRQQEADGDQGAYGSGPSVPRRASDPAANSSGASAGQQAASITPPTVLVFRDQHQQEIRNYAIVGQTLWSFAPQHTEKIPLSGLDLQATAKANDERGLTFRVPAAGEAQ